MTFLRRQWFLLILALALAVGIGVAKPLKPLIEVQWLRQSILPAVLFLMAFPMRATAIGNALRRPLGPLLASGINYGLLPLFAWLVVATLGAAVGLGADMSHGIFVASATPCTMASAAVWTRRAGGNDAIALVVTVITNSLCFLITPAWVFLLIGRMPQTDPGKMMRDLGLLIVLPMLLAQAVRLIGGIGEWATRHKAAIGISAQVGVLLMVFFGAIQTGNKYAGSQQSTLWLEIVWMIAIVLSVHLSMLYAGLWLSRLIGLPRDDAVAVGFAGSQKTLMVGLEVSAQIGVTMLPMVTYHVGQLLADTLVAERLRRQHDAADSP